MFKKIAPLFCIYCVEVFATCYALNIFISFFKWSPSYEGSGMQFVANGIIVAPVLGFLGVLYILFFRKFRIPLFNIIMPWLVITLVLVNPFFSTLTVLRVSAGALILFVLICLGIFMKVRHLLENGKVDRR